MVLVDQIQKGGFTKVRGLQRETRVESFREGGVNDYEHKLVTLTSYPNLVLERGLADPYLWHWHQAVVEGERQASPADRHASRREPEGRVELDSS